MAYGQILPDYIEKGLVLGYRCPGCGHTDEWFLIHSPQLKPTQDGNCVEIVYPVQCPCGRRGHISTTLPILLVGYLLARILLLESHKSRKQPKLCKPGRSRLLDKFIREFEQAMNHYAAVCSIAKNLQAEQEHPETPEAVEPTELDRMNFGFDDATWRAFLRRLGLDDDKDQDSK